MASKRNAKSHLPIGAPNNFILRQGIKIKIILYVIIVLRRQITPLNHYNPKTYGR